MIPGKTAAELTLLRVPREMFSQQVPEPPARHYRSVRTPDGAALDADDARFVGRHLLWGSKGEPTGYHLRYPPSSPALEVIPLNGDTASSVLIGHSASFVYGFAEHVLAIGTDGWHLHYSLIALAGVSPRVAAKYVLRDAVPKIARHGSATMISSGGEPWFIADVALLEEGADPRAQRRLPLSWSKQTATLVPAPFWSVPTVPRSEFQPACSELLALDERRVALRMQDQILVYDFAPQPVLRQRIPLAQ